MKKILVLGHTGMLGNCVEKYFKRENYNVMTIVGRWPDDNFLTEVVNADVDYVINCIGAIPQRTKDFELNYDLPIWLDKNLKCRIIHPGTDCEIDNDNYGISKRNASDYIKIDGNRTKIIKTSIIGHEINSSDSLLDWFLSNDDEVFGYTKAMWNGNTTLEWAKTCLDLIKNWELYDKETIISSRCMSKFDLLNEISNVYDKKIKIKPNDSVVQNKCLINGEKKNSIKLQLKELKKFYE